MAAKLASPGTLGSGDAVHVAPSQCVIPGPPGPGISAAQMLQGDSTATPAVKPSGSRWPVMPTHGTAAPAAGARPVSIPAAMSGTATACPSLPAHTRSPNFGFIIGPSETMGEGLSSG